MAAIPTAKFDITATEEHDAVIQSLSAQMETRNKKGSTTNEEQYRWIIRCNLVTSRKTITAMGDILDDVPVFAPDAHLITSNFKGSADISIRLFSADFSGWRCIGDQITGIQVNGSEMSTEVQQWIGLSNWEDAPWNGYWTP